MPKIDYTTCEVVEAVETCEYTYLDIPDYLEVLSNTANYFLLTFIFIYAFKTLYEVLTDYTK